MMKANEKQVRYCVAPVLMALGLWLTGNALLGMQSARGQEVAGNFKTPIPAPYYGNVTNMCTRSDSCTRLYEDVWGCKPAGFFDSCHDNVNRSVAVYSQKTYVLPLIPAVLYVTGMLPTAILSARGFQMHANTAAKQRGLAIALKPRHLNHNMNGKLSEVYNLLEYNIFEGCKLF